jgi:hypothetical protein
MARIGLSQLPSKVAAFTGKPAEKYRRFYDAAVESRIPAEFNGRWSVDEADIPLIAEAMGLSAPATQPRKASSALIAA